MFRPRVFLPPHRFTHLIRTRKHPDELIRVYVAVVFVIDIEAVVQVEDQILVETVKVLVENAVLIRRCLFPMHAAGLVNYRVVIDQVEIIHRLEHGRVDIAVFRAVDEIHSGGVDLHGLAVSQFKADGLVLELLIEERSPFVVAAIS